MPGPDEYDHNSKESAMHVLEVRNDELMDSSRQGTKTAPGHPPALNAITAKATER